jgi:hypothetical protein
LKSIEIPSPVVVLGKESFYWCESLGSVTFQNGPRLQQIDEWMFEASRVSFWWVSQEFARGRGSGKPEKVPEGFPGRNK